MRRSLRFLIRLGLLFPLLAGCSRTDLGPQGADETPPGLAERFYPPEGWAWGLVTPPGGTPQRYGVSAPPRAPAGDILILPGYGESAETWFETARDLNALGLVVWVLDAPGQGGSARLTTPRDLGYARDLTPGAAAVRVLAGSVIRPAATGRLAVLGEGEGALIALLAAEGMARPPDALILSAPPVEPRQAPHTAGALAQWLGIDRARPPGVSAWSRLNPDDYARGATHDVWRRAVTAAWQRANPALRMGGPSRAWISAVAAVRAQATAHAADLRSPVLVIDGACAGLPRCRETQIADAGASPELERDRARDAWLKKVAAFAQGAK